MNLTENLQSKRVAIVTHVYATGPAQELEEYLNGKVLSLIFIGHPFSFAKNTKSFYRIYSGGALLKQGNALAYRLPDILLYCKDFLLTILWIIGKQTKIDLYVGADPLNALAGLFLKMIGKVKCVIYYTIDYTPIRFENKILNSIYHKIESYCATHCDYVWNLSNRMIEARKAKGVIKTENQKVVPIGVSFSRISRVDIKKIKRHNLVYMGHVKKRQGLELIIESLQDILKKISDAKLMIIGSGDLEDHLKSRVKELGIESHVEFKGYIPDHKEVESLMSQSAIGLALYEPHKDSVTWYTDSSKPKQYMACGLPIIITDVAQISQDVEKEKLGIVVEYNQNSFVSAAINLLENDALYNEYRDNAIRYASNLEWNVVFSKALEEIIDEK